MSFETVGKLRNIQKRLENIEENIETILQYIENQEKEKKKIPVIEEKERSFNQLTHLENKNKEFDKVFNESIKIPMSEEQKKELKENLKNAIIKNNK